MYKLIIVDDEDIEREGMAEFIPWSNYDVKLVGTAWNGVEGLEKIQVEKPDIVLTDIKMPVMDGITLIKKTKEIYPNIEFIVLSGYGEYEYTSQAMGEGVRHYLLKPCDEEKIAQIIEKVKIEIEGKRKLLNKEKEYKSTVYRLLPRAKEQVFRNMLLGREQLVDEYQMFLNGIEDKRQKVFVLAMNCDKGFDNLEQFIIGNVLGELMGEKGVLLSTSIEHNVLFLVNEAIRDQMELILNKAKVELDKAQIHGFQAAISDDGKLEDVNLLYEQVQELFRMGDVEARKGLLHYGLFREEHIATSALVDYVKLKNSKEFIQILFEIFVTLTKMTLKNYKIQQMKETYEWIIKVLYGSEEVHENKLKEQDAWMLLVSTVNIIAEKQNADIAGGKEVQRFKTIILEIFRNIRNQELSIQFLSKEVLFMNEDYFGRIFTKNTDEKFSSFLVEQRINLSKCILQFDPDIKISQLAELVGYSADGQYFSKTFRKLTGITPIEYRDKLKSN